MSTFCPIPWIFQAVRSNGDVRVCCQANITKNRGVIRKDNGAPYNAGYDNLDEARNGQLIRDMRINMLNNVWNAECERCKQEEENGLTSRRTYENELWDYTIEQARAETLTNGNIDIHATPIRYYDLRFGNLCNLACRMCGPTDSSFWYEDWVSLSQSQEFQDTSGPIHLQRIGNKFQTFAYDWPKLDNFWIFLEANLQHLEHVYMAGGEPLLIERHYEFLQACIDADVAKNIRLEYNTNGTTLPPRVLSLWTHFKNVRVGVSIDGFGDTLEYQRYPAKWSKVLKNLHVLNGLPSNVTVWFAYTVTVYNVLHMVDFMRWKIEESGLNRINEFKKKPFLTHHVAHNPRHLNIRVLPEDFKQKVREKFDEFLSWASTREEHIRVAAQTVRDGVISYMDSESYHEEHWEKFLDYTVKLDAIRGQSITNVVPEFKEYFSG